jgi:hypothetical protein
MSIPANDFPHVRTRHRNGREYELVAAESLLPLPGRVEFSQPT